MTRVILTVTALALAPVAGFAFDGVASGNPKAAPTPVQCLLDPTACTVAERAARL